MTEAVIFDMDGLLVDSEPLWKKTEKEIFARLGIHLREEMQYETYGMQTDEVIRHWYKYKPWNDPDFKKLKKEFYSRIGALIEKEAPLMKGVHHALEFFRSRNYVTGLASSSPMELIRIVLKKFDLYYFFDAIHTSEDESFGKPHPAVYLRIAGKMGKEPVTCIAIEDSLAGLIAAKAARMKTICVPEASMFEHPGYGMADVKLTSLAGIDETVLKKLNNHG